MALDNQIPDRTLLRSVVQTMTRKGTGSSHVTASVRSGDVTLVGTIGFEYERRSIIRSVSNVPGVRRVIDQLRVEQRRKNWA